MSPKADESKSIYAQYFDPALPEGACDVTEGVRKQQSDEV